MTTPDERTTVVAETRNLPETLAGVDEIAISGLVQTVTRGLLKHYPLDEDLDVSASALPGAWTKPRRDWTRNQGNRPSAL